MAKKKKSKASLGCFFWIAFILLIGLLFLVNKGNISSALEKTNAKKVFSGIKDKEKHEGISSKKEITEALENIKKSQEKKEIPAEPEKTVSRVKEKNSVTETPKKGKQEKAETSASPKKTSTHTPKTEPAQTAKPLPGDKTESRHEKKDEEKKTEQEMRSAVLYFVSIDGDGKITRQQTKRNIAKSDSPMTDSINALLAGPNTQESKKGLRSLIPADTRLLSAYVKEGIATVNLSEEFQFNRYGIEGYTTQLAQIVFTIAVFPTVNSVQFLIEGQKKDYLGAEGVWIGSPLSTSSF